MLTHEADEIFLIRLKHPFGKLLTGSSERTINTLRDFIKREKPIKIFAVGDVVASNMIRSGIRVDSIIIDFKSERQPVELTFPDSFEVIRIKNPTGTITSAACEAVKKAVQRLSATAIVVEGEEDLLTLPAIRFAPLEALVVYGQPHVGIVLVPVTESIRKEAEQLLSWIMNYLPR